MFSLSIRSGLLGVSIATLALSAGVGYVALSSANDLEAGGARIYEEALPAIRIAEDMKHAVARIRILGAEHIMTTDPVKLENATAKLQSAVEHFENLTAQYDKSIPTSDTQEKATFAEMLDDSAQYAEQSRKFLEHSLRNENDAAAEIFLGPMGDLFAEMGDDYDKLEQRKLDLATSLDVSNQQIFDSSSMAIIGSIAALSALGIGLILYAMFGVARPIGKIVRAMETLARGDKTVSIPYADRRNELGAMAGAVRVFKDNMIEADKLRAEQERVRVEQEQARARIAEERKQSMLSLANQFESTIGQVVASVSAAAVELQATAGTLSQTADEASAKSATVATAADDVTRNVHGVAAATEELSASIREISGQTSQSARMVTEAVRQADQTSQQVMTLADNAGNIGAVVTLINDIANQTNLLALNATIEAARAGESGRGFAVVATEVKALASQTAKATDEIATQIRAMQEATTTSVSAMTEIRSMIDNMNKVACAIASAVEQQGAATQEISRNVQFASGGATQVSQSIEAVTRASEEASHGSGQVLSAASELARNSETLRTQVDQFLREVRAA